MKKETKTKSKKEKIKWELLLLAFLILGAVLILPTPSELSISGQRALAILAFAIVVWMTEAISYPVSATLIIALITLLLGLGPSLDNPDALMGTSEALNLALSGFSNSAVALVAGALFLAVAMQETGLDRRIALFILSKVGSSTRGVLIGAIIVGIALAFLIPSPTARVGAIIPIILGMISAFGLEKESRFSALLMISSAQIATIWSIGIKTATAQNMVALGFIEKSFGISISWAQWFLAAAPWSLFMTIVLYFVMIIVVPPEMDKIPNGQQMVRQQLRKLGAITGKQVRLLFISLVLLVLWSTEESLHPFDSTTTVLIAVAIMLIPGIGVLSWKQVEKLIPWGTIILFAAGISLGSVLLKTEAATWLANTLFNNLGLRSMPIFFIVAILAGFTIIIHLGFASATSLASTLIPVVIALVLGLEQQVVHNGIGIVLIIQFAVGFGFILPVNAPQNMLAYGTNTFTSKDLIKTGIPLTIIGYLFILLLSSTYWKWIDLL